MCVFLKCMLIAFSCSICDRVVFGEFGSMDNKGKSKANPHFDDDDDDLDLTLRLTLTPEPHDPSLPKEHDFMGLGGGSSGNKVFNLCSSIIYS